MTPTARAWARIIARHETGHRVVACALGLTVTGATPCEVDIAEPFTPRQRAAVAVAGVLAEGGADVDPQGHDDRYQLSLSEVVGSELHLVRAYVRAILEEHAGEIDAAGAEA